MGKSFAFGISCLALIGSGCGSDQTPAEFYVSVEQQWCMGRSAEEMMSEYYYSDMATRRFVNLYAAAFSNPSAEVERHCMTFDFDDELQETRTEEVSDGRFAILGMTMNGSFKRIPYQRVVRNDEGYLVKFEK